MTLRMRRVEYESGLTILTLRRNLSFTYMDIVETSENEGD